MARPLRRPAAGLLILLAAIGLSAGEPDDFRMIGRLLKEGARRTAAEQGRDYLRKYPQSPHRAEVAALVGRYLLDQGEAEGAVPLLREAAGGLKGAAGLEVSLDLAQALLDLRRAAEAAQVLKGLPKAREPVLSRALSLQARAADALDDPEGVAKALLALPERRRSPEDRYLLALSLAAMGKDREAVPFLEGLAQAPDTPPPLRGRVLRSLAEVLYRLGDHAGALEALSASPGAEGASEAALLRGWILLAQGRPAEAYDEVRRALPLEGWEEASALFAVRAAMLRRDFPAALRAARDLLDRHGRGAAADEARLTAARALLASDRPAEALAYLEPALATMDGEETKVEGALLAVRTAWEKLHDAHRARKWLDFAREAALSDLWKQAVALEAARFDWETGQAGSALEGLSTLIEQAPESPSAPGAALLMGRILLAEGHREKALSLWRSVVEAYPDSPEAREALLDAGEHAARAGDPETLLQVVEAGKAFAFGPAEARRFARLAFEAARLRGDVQEARLLLLASSHPAPDPEEADETSFQAALLDLDAGRLAEAREAMTALLSPQRRLALGLRCADRLAASGDLTQARALLGDLEAAFPGERATLLLEEANLALSGDDPAGAKAFLLGLAALAPAEPLAALAQRRLERLLLTQEGPEAALKAIPAFLEAEPTAVSRGEALLRQARLLRRQADDSAAQAYRRYLELRPSGPGAAEARLYLARLALARGSAQEAWNLTQGLSGPEAALLAGEAAFALRDMEKALQSLAPVLDDRQALSPDRRVRALYLAATAARVLGRSAEAEARFAAFVREAPATAQNLEDLLTAALFLQKAGRHDGALEGLGRLREAFRDARVGFQYAYTLELQGRREEALKAYLEVAFGAGNPEWALTARYRAAEILAAEGRKEDAAALYRRLVERTEGTVQGEYARRRLQELEGTEPPSPKEAPHAPAQSPP